MNSDPRTMVQPTKQCSALEWAILQTVAYADIFDFPLTAAEIHRYLVGFSAGRAEIDAALQSRFLASRLADRDGYFILAGRESLLARRPSRMRAAARLWPRARLYGRIMASLPYVRLVAVTGALALDNVEADDDIDYLVVTAPGRLWLCRFLVVVLVKLAALDGRTICPNYFLTENALALAERNLFTAHELVQMVPLSGLPVYQRMRSLNDWTAEYLPNAEGPPPLAASREPGWETARRWTEAALSSPVGARLEAWEMRRKVAKFGRQPNVYQEASFSADWCKGHFDGHGLRILDAYCGRLQALGREIG